MLDDTSPLMVCTAGALNLAVAVTSAAFYLIGECPESEHSIVFGSRLAACQGQVADIKSTTE